MRELIVQLSYHYPAMFRENNASGRKIPSVDRQAYLLCDRVFIIDSIHIPYCFLLLSTGRNCDEK